ncbi:hypothetical protein FN846DRAFT_945226 [Sphaerosporella brunnea]|uniref:Uncharacterized protein n=1 Tax=Sphaerosporella brunnea TaxID=1250544 RepID=A0A5J5F0I0_9PEZI|nr:hypothetical protein FN846DRAFT_945226 [Sphaerosporella brunnea]
MSPSQTARRAIAIVSAAVGIPACLLLADVTCVYCGCRLGDPPLEQLFWPCTWRRVRRWQKEKIRCRPHRRLPPCRCSQRRCLYR